MDLAKKNNDNGNPICPYCKIEVEPSDSGDTILKKHCDKIYVEKSGEYLYYW